MSDWRAPELEALCGSFLILTTASVALRFYVRRSKGVPLLADDWLMLLAELTFVGSCICIFIGIHFKNFGASTYSIPASYRDETLPLGEKLLTAVYLISYANLGFTKLSALFFYKRTFDVPGPSDIVLRVVLWTSIVIVACWLVAFEFLTGFQCGIHFSALWTSVQAHNEYCLYVYASLEGVAISDVILDVIVICLPLPWIHRLQTNGRKKLKVMFLFLLSLVGLGASLARMVVVVQLIEEGVIKAEQNDPRRIDSRLFFYYILESGMAIVAINLPVISMMLIRLGPILKDRLSGVSSSLTTMVSRSTRSSKRSISGESSEGVGHQMPTADSLEKGTTHTNSFKV